MKKRIIPVVALVLVLLGGTAAWSLAGTVEDPLISLGYLTGTFLPSVEQQIDEQLGALDQTRANADAVLAQKAAGYLAQANGSEDTTILYNACFADTPFRRGDTLLLNTGAGFLLREGTVKVTHDGAVVDTTTGTELASGSKLTPNHRYLVGEETSARFYISSEAATASAEGYYTLAPSPYQTMPFIDVAEDDWFHAAVTFAYANGLFSGTAANTFSPDLNITRAMVVTVLYQQAGRPAASANNQFTDVSADAYYAAPVTWATSVGVTAGIDAKTFGPNNNITREQLACMLYSFAANVRGLDTTSALNDLSSFRDRTSVSSYAQRALSWAVGSGVINGVGDNTLDPGGTATRAQMAAMLSIVSQLPVAADPLA